MLKKSLLLSLVILFVMAVSVFADFPSFPSFGASATSTPPFPEYKFSNGFTFGYQRFGDISVGVLSWTPNFSFANWKLGLDLTAPIGETRPAELNSVVLRSLGYDDGQKGFDYGMLRNLTLGHGLLMKNYSPILSGTGMPNNHQASVRAFFNGPVYGAEGLATWSHLYAASITEKINPRLTLGQYYVTDADGVNFVNPSGTREVVPAVAGIGVYGLVPIWAGLTGYVEGAQILGHGNGFTTGLDWSLDMFIVQLGFLAEYRIIGQNFVPGYFGPDYESNPYNLASVDASSSNKNGTLVQLSGKTPDNKYYLTAALENYNNVPPSMYAVAGADLSKELFASAYYKQPNFSDFRSLSFENGAIIGGTLGYKINPNMLLITYYKQFYDPTLGKVVTSQNFEVKFVF